MESQLHVHLLWNLGDCTSTVLYTSAFAETKKVQLKVFHRCNIEMLEQGIHLIHG